MRGEVNVAEALRSAPPSAGGLLWRAAEDTNALDVSDQGGTLPHRCCMILVQAAGVTDGGGGLGLSAHDVTAQDSLGDFGRVLRWRDACQGL